MSNSDSSAAITTATATTGSDAPTTDTLWTVKDVMAFLKVSRSWIYQYAASGELPCTKLGGFLRFEPEKIRAFARGEVKAQRIVVLSRNN